MIAVRTHRGSRLALRLTLIGLALWACMTAWAFSSPPGSGPDESSHLAAAWAVTHGQPARADTFLIPDQLWRAQCHAPPAVLPGARRGISPCIPPTGDIGTNLIRVANTTTLYPVTFHWLLGQFYVNDLTTSVYVMRIFVALVCTALTMVPLVLIGVIAGIDGLRRFGLPLLVSLSPLAFFFFGSVNPSAWDMAGALCAWGCMVALVQAKRRAHVVWALAGMVLGVLVGVLARPGGGLLLLATLPLAAPIALNRIAPADPRHRRRFWAVVSGCYLTIGAVAVTLIARGALAFQWDRNPPPSSHTALWHWFTDALNIGDYLKESFTKLGWLDTPIPSIVSLIFTALAGYLILSAVRQGRAAVTLSLLMTMFASWFLTTAVLATGTPPDTGLQTRYLWPVYVGVLMVAAAGLSTGTAAKSGGELAGHVRLLTGGGLIVASTVAYFTNIRRYTVGLDALPYVSPDRWHPPVLGTVSLLLVFLVAYSSLVLLMNVGGLVTLRRRHELTNADD